MLLIFQFQGELVSLGRYHLYDGPEARGGISAYRRLTGGRIINQGAGWAGCSLILPSRTAASNQRGAKLRPDQVMNRCARGALAALRRLGIDAFYPGRDAITNGGRELAICTFEETSGGALLFELFLALEHGLDSLPREMERFDPEGNLSCQLYTADTCTTLAREMGRSPGFDELATCLEAGYGAGLGSLRRRELTPVEIEAARAHPPVMPARSPGGHIRGSSMPLVARQSIQLGSMEVRMAAAGDRIERIAFYGDFIANSPGLGQFEQNLVDQRLDLMSLTAAVMQVYGDGSNYILGCGELGNLTRLILKAS